MRRVWCTTAMMLGLLASPVMAEQVPVGVYDCFGSGLAEGEVLRGAAGQLTLSGGKFAVFGPGKYLSRGGKTGSFSFDGSTLKMIDGPYAGISYLREKPYWAFHMYRPNGQLNHFNCPLNTAKDPQKPNAW